MVAIDPNDPVNFGPQKPYGNIASWATVSDTTGHSHLSATTGVIHYPRCPKCNSTFVHEAPFDVQKPDALRIFRCWNCDHREERWSPEKLVIE